MQQGKKGIIHKYIGKLNTNYHNLLNNEYI